MKVSDCAANARARGGNVGGEATDDLVTKARALLAAATPGPRVVDADYRRCLRPMSHGDILLINAAPTLLAELCDEVEALRRRVAGLEKGGTT